LLSLHLRPLFCSQVISDPIFCNLYTKTGNISVLVQTQHYEKTDTLVIIGIACMLIRSTGLRRSCSYWRIVYPPKGIAVEGAYFTKSRLTAGIGVAYTIPTKTVVKAGANEYDMVSNMLDVFAYAGYKFLQVDYVVSAFVNAGYTMGDVNSLQPFVSTKVLFPAGRKSFSVEPFYVFNRGMSARASVYIKL
jgi:hypothetical protein